MEEEGRELIPVEGRNDFWKNPRPTNENPNFVRDYFASSRLHFIGSFRARYESMMVSVGKKLGVNAGDLLQSSAEKAVNSSKRKKAERVIVHVDMDCFFASVAVKKNPSLSEKCIAVCHGGGEISSCSYEARKYGVRAGMFFRNAVKICPGLLSVPYDFSLYEEVSIQIYARFYSYHGVCVEAASVDEAYLDFTLAVGDDSEGSQSGAEALVRDLRSRIYSETGCTASAGIGPSKLIARLATKEAKPNGQLRIRQENVIQYLDTLNVKDLPGIGWRTTKRLAVLGVKTCPQLRSLSLSQLQSEFGERQGQVFHDLSRALDDRQVEPLKPRKSIGAEASWGIRFMKDEGEKARKFIMDMADEVADRVVAAGAHGTKVTFKVYRKKPNSSMVGSKYLGHGPCTVLTRSARISAHTLGVSLNIALRETCLRLHVELGVRNEEFRGVGLQMTDLSFSDLNFDHTSGPTSGATRRIDSFFEVAPPSSTKPDFVSLKSGQPSALSTRSSENDSDVVAKGTSRNNFGDSESVVVSDRDVQLEEESDEDIIAIGRARPSRRINIIEKSQTESIPSGWDKDVFRALPHGIRKELLEDNEAHRVVAQAITIAAEGGENNTMKEKREQTKRKRGQVKRVSFRNNEEKRSRGRQTEQVTMTQFAAISELKEKGHEVLNAEEFRKKPLRECVDLLEDLRVKRMKRMKVTARMRVGNESSAGISDEKGWWSRGRAQKSRDGDIPSPPSLSSDSGGSESVDSDLEKGFEEDDQVYEDERIEDYGGELKRWMLRTGGELRSGHVELIRGRVLEFVRKNMLERARIEMSVIKRFVESEGMGEWKERYNGLVGDVQKEGLRLYGFLLALPTIDRRN